MAKTQTVYVFDPLITVFIISLKQFFIITLLFSDKQPFE